MPLPSSISQSAIKAAGSAASWDSTNAATIKRGSCRYPSLHNRHIDDSAGGSGPGPAAWSVEDVIRRARLILGEALRLQVEHRPISSAQRNQFVVRAEFDDAAAFEDADTIGVPHRREPMRDKDRRALARRSEQAIEDLGLAAHIELRGRVVEQHDARAEVHRAPRARQSNALPLAAGQVGAAVVATGEHRIEAGQVLGAGGRERLAHDRVWRARWGDVVAQRQLEADEVLENGRDTRAPRVEI